MLQTWTRDLRYHPHVHCVVPAGGLSADGLRWIAPKRENSFLPQAVLALRLRTRLKHGLGQDNPQLFALIPKQAWSIDWVADVQAVGSGEPALKYLAAYVYRTALGAERILSDDGQHIAFKESKTARTKIVRLTGQEFLHRFLQHVLPKGFQRVRSFGLLSPAAKHKWQRVLALFDWQPPPPRPTPPQPSPHCPGCKNPMVRVGRLPRAPP